MKKVYFSFLILFIVLLFVAPVIFAEPNTNLSVLLYSEDKEDTATHLKLYASDEITSNKRIIYSIIITASIPSPLGQGNVIDQGLTALVVPEDAEVDYQNIEVYGAPTPDSEQYEVYQPESESTKIFFDLLESLISKSDLGLILDLAPLYQFTAGDYENLVDLNQYDIVKVNWETPRLKYWQKVQIDIPVTLGDNTEVGLYAYWQSRASSSDGTGPVHARDNVVDIGFNIKVISKVEKHDMLTWEKTFGGSEDDRATSIIQTIDGGYVIAGSTESKGAGEGDAWVIKLDNEGNIVWDKTFGGGTGDWAWSVIQTTDGGYAVVGVTSSKGAGNADFWVIKLDSQGNMIWDKTFGGSDEDWATSIIQTNDGGIALAGWTKSKGVGGADFWVIKLDSQGNMLWERIFGGSADDLVFSIIQTNDGGYAVTGFTASKGAGSTDAWLIKLDSQGNKLWDKTYGGSNGDVATSIIQTTDGGYTLAGLTTSKGAGNADFWVIKLDSEGNILWDKTYDGGDNDMAWSIIQTTDGGYVVEGLTNYSSDVDIWGSDVDIWIIKLDYEGNILWDKVFETLGKSGYDLTPPLIQTTDGGYAIACWINLGAGNYDVWVIKMDEGGNLGKVSEEKPLLDEVSAKTEMIVWEKTFGGSNLDVARSLIQTTDGGYAVAGYTCSQGAGDKDFWVIKLDSEGNRVWDKTYGGDGADEAYSLIQTTDNGYAVAGVTELKGAGGYDFWVIKLDDQGNQLWDKTFGGNGSEAVHSIIQTTDDGYAVAGHTHFKSKGAGYYDFWVIKLDSQGNQLWDKTFGGSSDDWAYSLIQTTDGGYIVAGITKSKGAGYYDFWVIKLDSQGNQLWDKTFGGSNSDWAFSLIQTTDGGYAVAGYTRSQGAGDKDFWVIKLDSEGNRVWDKTYGGDGADEAYSLIQTTDGGYAVAGYTRSKGAGEEDAWVIKLDSQGNIVWDKTYGGEDEDEAKSLIQTTDGGYAVAGYTESKGAGSSDFWVIKLDE